MGKGPILGFIGGVTDRNKKRFHNLITPTDSPYKPFINRPAPLMDRMNNFGSSMTAEAKNMSGNTIALVPTGPGWKFGNRFKDPDWAKKVESHFKASGLETNLQQDGASWYLYYKDNKSGSQDTRSLVQDLDRMFRESSTDEAQAIRDYPKMLVALDRLMIDLEITPAELRILQGIKATLQQIVADEATHAVKFGTFTQQFESISTRVLRGSSSYVSTAPRYDWDVIEISSGARIATSLTEQQANGSAEALKAAGQNVMAVRSGFQAPPPLPLPPPQYVVAVNRATHQASVSLKGTIMPGWELFETCSSQQDAHQVAETVSLMYNQGQDPFNVTEYAKFAHKIQK